MLFLAIKEPAFMLTKSISLNMTLVRAIKMLKDALTKFVNDIVT